MNPKPSDRAAGRLIWVWLLAGPMLMLSTIWVAPLSAGEDDLIYYFPLRVMVGRALAEGRLPLTQPWEQCGARLMADPQAAVMYPPTWLFATGRFEQAYALNVFLALAAAGAGAYVYLRKIGLAPAAGALGATAFQYSGFMLGHRVHLSMIATAAMLGWMLWCIESMRDRPRRALLAWPMVLLLAVLAGHWPILIQLGPIVGLYLLLRARPLGRSLAIALGGALLALVIAAPQLQATRDLLAESTRSRVGLWTAGENSFFPANLALAVFPLIFGCRTQNFFAPQDWWGVWHLCEMLGYVGLITLALAATGLWRLWRRADSDLGLCSAGNNRGWPVARTWGLLLGVSAVWMLGYYLPPVAWLIHKLPVLGIVRAPARLVAGADFALATLAALALHAMIHRDASAGLAGRIGRSLRRWLTVYLPIWMGLSLLLVLLIALTGSTWWTMLTFGQAGPADAWQALRPTNPAIWVPLLVWVVTVAAGLIVLRNPARHGPLLTIVLACDLLILAQSVDVPGDLAEAPDPLESTPAAIVKADAAGEPFRVLHLSGDYHASPTQVLAPKTCAVYGVESLAGYGPFQPGEHAQLLGLRIFGDGPGRDWLIRSNHVLSLLNVRYILATDEFRELIESVVIDSSEVDETPAPLGEQWRTRRATVDADGVVTLTAMVGPIHVDLARAECDAPPLAPGGVYRLEMQVRSPEGASGFISADLWDDWNAGLTVHPEFIGPDWRTQKLTFRVPENIEQPGRLRLRSISETPIEVRDVRLVSAGWERPINLGDQLAEGERVYEQLARVLDRDGTAVTIYRNRLCLARSFTVERLQAFADTSEMIEQLKWNARAYDLTREALVVAPSPIDGPGQFVSERAVTLGSPVGANRNAIIANALGHVTLGDRPAGPPRGSLRVWQISLAGLLGYGALAGLMRVRAKRC